MVDDRTALMSARALSPGYEILWYTIDKVLGQGGFGITYLAHDQNLDRAVAIKEYLPTSFAYRHQDYSVKPITGDHRENFVWGLGSFLKEAQTLARFGHPNIVRVHSVFEANKTAYMVMEYEHGQNLAKIYQQKKGLDQAFFEQVFFPIFDGLKEIHAFDFIHRDIKPANIYIRNDGTPVLIDFGSARQTTQQQTTEMTTLVCQGYTPLEQYSANYGEQGPWTDIYALAATLYEGIVGHKPDESLSRSACRMRSRPDPVEALDTRVHHQFSQVFLDAVLEGLKLEPELRPQSLESWRAMFAGEAPAFDAGTLDDNETLPDLEQTRIQPRPGRTVEQRTTDEASVQKDFDSFLDASSSQEASMGSGARPGETRHQEAPRRSFAEAFEPPLAPEGGGRRIQSADGESFLDQDDLLTWDDEALDTASRQRSEHTARATEKPADAAPRSRLPALIAAAALVLLVAGGAYMMLVRVDAPEALSVAVLEGMPAPEARVETTLPEELVLERLDSLLALATLLSEARVLDRDDASLKSGIHEVEQDLLTIARQWNASRYPAIAGQVRQVSQALPASEHDQKRLAGILDAATQRPQSSRIMALLEDRQYLLPAGHSLLDRITSVSPNHFRELTASSEWEDMMRQLSQAAKSRLAESRFEEAARMTEAALTLDSDHAGFTALRGFLSQPR